MVIAKIKMDERDLIKQHIICIYHALIIYCQLMLIVNCQFGMGEN